MAVAGIRNAIDTRGRPFGGFQVIGTRIPVCEDDRRRVRRTTTRVRVTFLGVFVFVLFTGALPGPLGVFTRALDPFGGTAPEVRTLVFAALVFFGFRFVRMVLRGAHCPARPVRLLYERGRGGYVWLRGADPRCLMHLPSVTPSGGLSPKRARSGSGELVGERRREPLLVARGRPASVADEEAVDLGRHQRVDHVGRVAFPQPGLERVRAGQ